MQLRDDADPFWRTIDLVAGTGRVDAEVSDNVHQFSVSLVHDTVHVTGIEARAIRVPWVTCPGAIAGLRDLVGAAVADAGRAAIDQAQQCTHLLDLARLAIAQAGRGGCRTYRFTACYDAVSMVAVARLQRDGEPFQEWRLRDGQVVSPGPFLGHQIEGRSAWSEAVRADADLREAGLIMRRALFVYRSRTSSQPRRSAAEIPELAGVCYSFQPERSRLAHRPPGFAELP